MASYTIQAGDTLSGIARKLGVTVDAIVQANKIANPSLIHPGQVLTIPGTPQPPTPPALQPTPNLIDHSTLKLFLYYSNIFGYNNFVFN